MDVPVISEQRKGAGLTALLQDRRQIFCGGRLGVVLGLCRKASRYADSDQQNQHRTFHSFSNRQNGTSRGTCAGWLDSERFLCSIAFQRGFAAGRDFS